MSTALSLVGNGSSLPAALGSNLASATDLAKAEKAASTRKAYSTDFRLFRAWCDARGVSSLPADPETVAAYLAASAGSSKASTLGRRIAAIRYAHKLANVALPTDAEGVKATMRGIRRTHGAAKLRKAPAVASKVLGEAGSIFRPSTKRARCGPRGLPVDRSPTSSRRMLLKLGSMPAHFQAIHCGPVS